jgi:hypothetical protein
MITTPTKPNGNQFEDLITACMWGLGYFTETRLVLQKQSAQVLEFDSVATPSGQSFEDKFLVEAKSRDNWGSADLYKMNGQMFHVGINRGRLVYFESITDGKANAMEDLTDDISKVANDPGRLACARVPLGGNGEPVLDFVKAIAPACRPLSDERLAQLVDIGWFGQIAQRLAFAQFGQQCKSVASPLLTDAQNYQNAVTAAFFKRSPLVRVDWLYDAWKAKPNLAGEFVTERAKAKGVHVDKIWQTLCNTDDLLWLQYVMLMEHKARLRILKNGLEHLHTPGPGKPTHARIEGEHQCVTPHPGGAARYVPDRAAEVEEASVQPPAAVPAPGLHRGTRWLHVRRHRRRP